MLESAFQGEESWLQARLFDMELFVIEHWPAGTDNVWRLCEAVSMLRPGHVWPLPVVPRHAEVPVGLVLRSPAPANKFLAFPILL